MSDSPKTPRIRPDDAGPAAPASEPPSASAPIPGSTAARSLAASLLAWFRDHRRDLPWRRTADPYAVWVAEVMLQQTQVATVIPYFELWMARFPTLRALAEAEEEDVLHVWQGLGYYSRARNLLRGARAVMERHGGRLPEDPAALRALPGVGPYTAGAIASIAFDRPAPVVDGNVTRVLTRLFALSGDPKRAPLARRLWELAEALIPEGAARDFNQALMELGALVCTPRAPRCEACPVAAFCAARAAGCPEAFPQTAARPKPTPVHMVAGLVWRRAPRAGGAEGDSGWRVLLAQRRPDESRWAGMWQFPNTEVRPGESAAEAVRRAVAETVGLEAEAGPRVTLVRHSVTRYRITLEAYHCHCPEPEEPAPRHCRAWRWVCPSRLGEYALPAAHRAIARRLTDERRQLELNLGG